MENSKCKLKSVVN